MGVGFNLTSLNANIDTLKVKFDLDSSFWTSSIQIGWALGAWFGNLSANSIIKRGRLNATILTFVVFIAATVLTVLESLPSIIVGRFLQGFVAPGIAASLVSMYISETVPNHMVGKFGVLIQWQFMNGVLLANVLGHWAPASTDSTVQQMKDSQYWRYSFGSIGVIYLVAFILFIIFFRHETPKYSLMILKDEKKATRTLEAIYTNKEDIPKVIKHLNETSSQNKTSISLMTAACDRRYRGASWRGFSTFVIRSICGAPAVMMYSS